MTVRENKKNSNFNEVDYLKANPDVFLAVNSGQFSSGFHHYDLIGKYEGRKLSSVKNMTRIEKVLSCLKMDGKGLEIGPSHNPIAPKKNGFDVQIVDHLDRAGLIKKYESHANLGVNIMNIEDVDYVWQGQPLSELVGFKYHYDWLIASHVIEHIPDLITFIQQCEILLNATGHLSLVIPDKQFCFDYFNPTSTTGEFLDAYHEKRVRPTPGKVFDHFANACKRGGKGAWGSDEIGEFELIHSIAQASNLWKIAQETNDYIDSHCWRFTPESFKLVINDLTLLGLINFDVYLDFPTVGCQFFVTLDKNRLKKTSHNRLINLQAIKDNSI